MTRSLTVICTLCVTLSTAQAQIPDLGTFGPDWIDLSYPKIYYAGRDGFAFGLYYAQVQPMGYDDWEDPEPYHAKLSFDGLIATSGRKELTIEGRMPKLMPGWRLSLRFKVSRHPRERYFGLGNDTEFVDDSVNSTQPNYYDSDETRLLLRGEIQRRVVGHLRLLGGFHLERWRVTPPDGPSVLALDVAAGVDPNLDRHTNDFAARIGVVFDSRDDESAPRRGVRLETIYSAADASVIGDVSYTRWTFTAAGYAPLPSKFVIAGRIVGQTMTGDPPVGTISLIESSDRPSRGFGGSATHRALNTQRFLGEDLLFANFDLRYDLLRFPKLLEVTTIAFVDAGRVFRGGKFELTTSNLHVGGGAGLVLRVRRSGVLGFTLATGPDGFVAQLHSRWTY